MIWVDIITTFIIATLSGMGIGSGGLMVLYLTLIRDAPQLLAQGFNLLFFLFATAASMLVHLLRRRIFWLAVVIMIAAGLPAAYLGTRTALWLPDAWGARLFGLFLIVVGLPGVWGRKRQSNVEKT
jgi:uncharacterized membrane protein YfcA